MATSIIPLSVDSKIRKIYVYAGGSLELNIEAEKTYLIHMMTSSETSGRVLVIARRGNYISKLVLSSGSYQTYFTETLSNNVWHITCQYYTMVDVIEM